MGYVKINNPRDNESNKLSSITSKLIESIVGDSRGPILESVEYGPTLNELIIFTNKKNKRDGIISITHGVTHFKIVTGKLDGKYIIYSNMGSVQFMSKDFSLDGLVLKILDLIFSRYIDIGSGRLTGINDIPLISVMDLSGNKENNRKRVD